MAPLKNTPALGTSLLRRKVVVAADGMVSRVIGEPSGQLWADRVGFCRAGVPAGAARARSAYGARTAWPPFRFQGSSRLKSLLELCAAMGMPMRASPPLCPLAWALCEGPSAAAGRVWGMHVPCAQRQPPVSVRRGACQRPQPAFGGAITHGVDCKGQKRTRLQVEGCGEAAATTQTTGASPERQVLL